jgi:hypothetical protein
MSAATGWTCTQSSVRVSYDNCKGGAPDDKDLTGCAAYDYQGDHGKSSLYKGQGFLEWAAAPGPPCFQSHGGYEPQLSSVSMQ